MKKKFLCGCLLIFSVASIPTFAISTHEIEGFQASVAYDYFKLSGWDEPQIDYFADVDGMYVKKSFVSGGVDARRVYHGYMEFDLTSFLTMNIQIDSITKITITTTTELEHGYLLPFGFFMYAMDSYEDGAVLGLEDEYNAFSVNIKYIPCVNTGAMEIELTGDELQFVTGDIEAGKTITGFMLRLDDESNTGTPTYAEGVWFGSHADPILTIEYDESIAFVPEPLTGIMVLFGVVASLIRTYKRS